MSSTPSSSVVWKFFQANLGRSKIATKELKELKCSQNYPFPDIYLIQEPYTYKGKATGLPLSWKVLSAEHAKVLVAVRNNNINIIARHVSKEIVIADLFDGNGQITVASIYFPPSKDKTRAISELEASMKDIDTSKMVFGGDINMRSILWGPDIPDHRAADDGGPFVDFIMKYSLQIINNPNSPSTFESKNGKSWIDVTVSSRGLHNKISNWTVNKNVFSDHSYLSFDISLATGPTGGYLRISKRKIYKLGNLVADKFRNAEAEITAHLKVPWWDLELELQRKKTRALRFRYQRCKQDIERQHRRSLFKREEAKYRWLIKVKSRDSFEKLCVLLTGSNPFDLPYKLATGKCKKKIIYNTVFDQHGNKTKSIEETIAAIVHKLFPQEEEQMESARQKRVRDSVAGYSNIRNDRTFTKLEIREVIRGMAKNKAPGLDSINVLMAEVIHKKSPEILTGIFNKCLQLGVFPKEWKKAKLILINKPGKDPELANSYRPICLLSVLSKILDKLITQRITYLLKSRGMLHKQQHGFRNGRSCETANYELRKSIQKAMQHKFKVCLVSLDVAGAFDNVWRHSILEQLIRAECPFNLFTLIKDYFEDRHVVYEISNNQWTFYTQRGVPQGSCSGPLFWNLVVSTALDLALPQGCQIQAFADDLIIVVRGVNTESLTIRCNEAISRLVAWGKTHKLQFNASKTTLMPITFGGRLTRNEPLQVVLEGHQVTIKDQIVYLGVTWDSALTFTPHFKKVRQRVDILTYKITSVADNFYWRHNRMFKRIYTGAIEPYILYGHGAWGNRLQLKTVDKFLNGIQRRPLIKLTRAFRTTSTEALQVIAGVLPLSLKAIEVYTKFLVLTVKINATVGTKVFNSAEVEEKRDIFDRHPADWCSVPFGTEGPVGEDIEIYTDGSGIDGKVGAAMVVFFHGTEVHHEICRLEDSATVFQAETKGIQMALEYINNSKQWHRYHIFSDSKSVY
ncbi:Retrovirus-related Pol polyprotein from type-1 retrotransposable element R1 [Araneus ventricosus]|uniref:Retrovirus-related Pol polyprotein from type-1 retrotransposable element R1 n=1 Tax=Araneus ventricosus TaxID=182803 RepID=A0A4Y2DIU2_ARAVE|nr:Retrovirus-related Pol polyprotein from type-1 retrotransposable element R1 [Araneus ventricosus]